MIGACHATASVLYVVFSELGFHPEICVGEVGAKSMPFDHSWIKIDKKIVDLACFMTLLSNGMPISNPVIFDNDAVSGYRTELVYGIETGLGFDAETQLMLKMSFNEYIDNFPYEKNGLWDVVSLIIGRNVDTASFKKKYEGVQRKYVTGHSVPDEWLRNR